jgi:two-component system phosphate regulon sensor histidine kinase PhoR
MWQSKLFWKLFLVYGGLIIILLVGFFVGIGIWQRSQVSDGVQERLHATAAVLRSDVREDLLLLSESNSDDQRIALKSRLQQSIVKLGKETQLRLTLVMSDGTVVADSERDPATLVNHLDRPELVQARTEKFGKSTRHSTTVGYGMSYFALAVRNGGDPVAFVRTAMDLAAIEKRYAAIRAFLLTFALICGVLALVVTYVMVGRVIRPLTELTKGAQAIAKGEENDPVSVRSKDEIGSLAAAFNRMQTELSRRVNQLRSNNEQMTTVLAGMSEGVIAVNAKEEILVANDACRKMLEFATPDAVGRPLIEVTRSRALYDAVIETMRTGRAVMDEFEIGRKTRLKLCATGLPGEPASGAVVVLHDVTELRRLENLRRELVANVSHELKTPLSAIKAYAETLRLGAVNDAENNIQFVMQIEEQADRLNELIHDLLQIARIESGQEAFDIAEVIVADVVQSCLSQYARVANAKQVHLTSQAPDYPIIAKADEEGLRTILSNLIDNAIKYTPDGGTVSLRWFEDDAQVVIEVQDSGIGIPLDHQARVFERFYRVDKARSRELGGTGLGLSIVKHLSHAFGGSVQLSSEPDQGSVFTIRLPTKNAPVLTRNAEQQAAN